MNKIKSIIYQLSSIALVATCYLLLATSVQAATQCQPIYGGGQTCVESGNIVINKEVLKPGTSNVYVDNLTVNDPKWGVDQTFNFRITVTNTGGTTISKVTVQDFLPSEAIFIAGPGSFANGVFSADIVNLNPNQPQTLVITVKANQLNANELQRCEIVNRAVAIVDGRVEDTAKFCIAKPEVTGVPATTSVTTQGGVSTQTVPGQVTVPGVTKGGLKVFPPAQVKTTPSTGPEMLALIGLIPGGLAGLFLRRKASQ